MAGAGHQNATFSLCISCYWVSHLFPVIQIRGSWVFASPDTWNTHSSERTIHRKRAELDWCSPYIIHERHLIEHNLIIVSGLLLIYFTATCELAVLGWSVQWIWESLNLQLLFSGTSLVANESRNCLFAGPVPNVGPLDQFCFRYFQKC